MPRMNNSVFQVGAAGIDVAAVLKEIEETVARKSADGAYADARVARAERTNLANLTDDQFLEYYIGCLRDAVYVDISDFNIRERRSFMPGFLVAFKRLVWKLLKFYTYRLWSQQNEVNGLLLSAVETLDGRYRERIQDLEARIAQLEKCIPPKE